MLARILHKGNEVTTGILPFALRASRAVQIRSRRICQGKSGKQGRTGFEVSIRINAGIQLDYSKYQSMFPGKHI